jgi:hypothetical protein
MGRDLIMLLKCMQPLEVQASYSGRFFQNYGRRKQILDWFFRGFYSTDFVDIGIKDVKQYYVSETPTVAKDVK